MSVQYTQTLNCSAEQLKKAILDCDQHAKHFKGVKSSKVVARKDDIIDAAFQLNLIIDFGYTIRLQDKGNTIEWSMLDSDIFKKMTGSWKLEPEGKNQVKATYSIDVDFKLPVPKMVKNRLVGSDLKNLMDEYEKWAQTL